MKAKIKINKVEREFIVCECHSEAVSVEYDNEYGDLSMAFWRLAGCQPYSFWKRIRWIWHILRTGNFYDDMVMLDEKEVKKLIKVLTKFNKKQNDFNKKLGENLTGVGKEILKSGKIIEMESDYKKEPIFNLKREPWEEGKK